MKKIWFGWSRPRSITKNAPKKSRQILHLEKLEAREVPAILSGQLVSFATFLDSDGDTVSVKVTGNIIDPATQGIFVELEGKSSDNADAYSITLSGLTRDNGLEVVVTPNVQKPQPSPTGSFGNPFATLYSPGYTNIASIETTANSIKTFEDYSKAIQNPPMSELGSIYLSAAIVNKIDLGGISKVEGQGGLDIEVPRLGSVSIKNDITLDCGLVPFVDRINTQNNQQATDSTMYNPASGLISLGGISAANVGSIIINGVISPDTKNPFDTATTNDFRSVIEIQGTIGKIIGLRSNLRASVRAERIQTVRVASLAGEITTRDKTSDLAINLPNAFNGFINSAGHLHLGFPLADGSKITGQIQALGVSGNAAGSYTDPLNFPETFIGSIQVTGDKTDQVGWYATHPEAVGNFPDINVDGIASFGLTANHGNIGNLQSDGYDSLFVALSREGSIGNMDAGQGGFEGQVRAKLNVGYLEATKFIAGTIVAGGNIGAITSQTAHLESLAIQAGGDIGLISTFLGIEQTSIVAGGDIAGFRVRAAGIRLATIRAENIGSLEIVDGGLEASSLVATGNIGSISTFGNALNFGISDVSIVAGGNIGLIQSQTHTGDAIRDLKLEAQGKIEGVLGISFGQLGQLGSASGIFRSHFAAAEIGQVYGRSVGGRGIEESQIVTFNNRDGNNEPNRTTGGIGLVTGSGWLDGLFNVIVVAHSDIEGITGSSIMDGSGINGGSFDANYGNIGPVKGTGGATGGSGITNTRIQALTVDNPAFGSIASLTASANANGLDALVDSTLHGAKIGPINVTVHGGTTGNGIVRGDIKAFGSKIESIRVDIRSTNGIGILDGKISASSDMGPLTVTTLNNTGISRGEFSARGAFQDISVHVQKGGTGIDGAKFEALGRISFWNDPKDPRGNFGNISVTSEGKTPESNGIANATFTAIGEIGKITAKTMGGTAILNSVFTADSDGDYDPNSSNPGENYGNIAAIYAESAGRQLALSSAIVGSTFTSANMGDIEARVSSVEGGAAIDQSGFIAKTAVYDGKGNFNNTGKIGNILVDNRADQNLPGVGAGVSKSYFHGGPAGGIGNITISTRSGSGITESQFDTALLALDLDQGEFSAKIGDITVNSGRNGNFTLLPVGINLSQFTSPAGIGNITVNSIGAGITGSVFTADFDWTLNNRVRGDIGNISVRVPGRNASGISGSVFFASNIGDIQVVLADEAAQGLNTVVLSNFTAWSGSIGNITIIHSQTGTLYNIGLSYAILTSAFTAATAIESITIEGRTLGAVFVVSGNPVQVRTKVVKFTPSIEGIGPVLFSPFGINCGLRLDSANGIETITIQNAPAGGTVNLEIDGPIVGNILVESQDSLAPADLAISGSCITFGSLTVDGGLSLTAKNATSIGYLTTQNDASLNLPLLEVGNAIQVGGMLTLPKGLPALTTLGVLSAGTIFPLVNPVQIGLVNAPGSSMGPINIGRRNTGKTNYEVNFGNYTGITNVVVGSGSVKLVPTKGVFLNGFHFVRTAPIPAKKVPAKSPITSLPTLANTTTPAPAKNVVPAIAATMASVMDPIHGTSFAIETQARAFGYGLVTTGANLGAKVGIQLANIPEAETLDLQVLTGLTYWNGIGQPKFTPVKGGVEVNLQVAGQDLRIGEKTDTIGGLNPAQIRRTISVAVSDGQNFTNTMDVAMGTGGQFSRFAKSGAPNGVYAFTGSFSVQGDSSLGLTKPIRESLPVAFVFSVGQSGHQVRAKALSLLENPSTRPVSVVAVNSEWVPPPKSNPQRTDQGFIRFYVHFSDPVTVVRNSPLLPVIVNGKQTLVAIEPGTNLVNVKTLSFKFVPTKPELDAARFEFGKTLQIGTGGSLISAAGSIVPILSLPAWTKQPAGLLAKTMVISSDIVRNTTFIRGVTHIIEGEIHVRSGVTLTIEDGVTILIRNGLRAIRNISTSALVFDSGSRMVAGTVTFGATDHTNIPVAQANNGGVFFCGSTRPGTKDNISSTKQGLASSFTATRIVAAHLGRQDPLGGDGDGNGLDDVDALSVIGVGELEWKIKGVESRFSGDDGFDVTNSSITLDELVIANPVEDGLNITSSLVQIRRNCSLTMSLDKSVDRELFDLEVTNGPSRIILAKDASVDLKGFWGNIFDEVGLASPDMPQPLKRGAESHWYKFNGKLLIGPATIYGNER